MEQVIRIDDEGYMLDLYLLEDVPRDEETGVLCWTVVREGIADALGMIRPRWTGDAWTEAADEAEIESRERAREDALAEVREQAQKAEREQQALSAAAISFVLMAQAEQIDDVTITEHAELFAAWDINWTGKAATILQDEGALYRSIHDVGPGQNTKPSQTPAMWTRIGNPADEYPEWVPPIGAHDAYLAGAKVTHSGQRWVNAHGDGNIWEPGVFGWEVVLR